MCLHKSEAALIFSKKKLQNEAGQEVHQNCINPNQDGFFIGLFWGGVG